VRIPTPLLSTGCPFPFLGIASFFKAPIHQALSLFTLLKKGKQKARLAWFLMER